MTRKQQIILYILIITMTAITFFAGYAVSFYCTTINVDYSANHIETYKNVTVKYDPEFNQFTVIDKNGKEKYTEG